MKEMPTMLNNKFHEKGQSALIIVFIIGMAATFLSLGFSELATRQAQVARNTGSSNKAYYAAQAGIEDVILHLRQSSSFGDPTITLASSSLNMDGAVYYATTSALSETERVATATGKFGGSVKTIEVKVLNSEQGTGFLSAVQTGNGGFELEHGTKICTGNGTTCTGNTTVYSNADIKGQDTDTNCTNVNSSKIIGSATAVGNITRLTSSDDGPCITQDASASALLYCRVVGNRRSTQGAAPANCTGGTFSTISSAPPPLELPEFNEDYWRVQATNSAFGGTTYNGSCNVGGTPDCSSGAPNYEIGPMKVKGNMTIKSGTDPMITGPIWVTGNLTFESNNDITLDPDFMDIGTIMMADGIVDTNSNVQYPEVGLSIVLVVSTKDYAPGYDCASPAINIDSNVRSVIFYSLRGCVNIKSNASFYGAVVGQKVHLNSNAEFYYNELFKDATFGVAAGGGWLITSWRNID